MLYRHRSRDLLVVVHVDDFLVCGVKQDLVWFRDALKRSYEIKSAILGNGKDESTEIGYLKRSIKINTGGLTYEGDSKHIPTLLQK